MKKAKKLLSILMVAVMLVCIVPIADLGIEASAAGGVAAKLEAIRQVYPSGSYFTTDGTSYSYNSGSKNYLRNIPSRGGLTSGAEAANVMGDAWSCVAFAKYVFYNIFKTSSKNEISLSNAKIGDYVEFSGHAGIYLSHDSAYVYVYDSNWQSPPQNKVGYNTAVPMSRFSKVYRASNYNEIDGNNEPFDPKASGTYIGQVTDSTFRPCIVMTSMSGVKEILVAVWSADDQSDLKWYDCLNNGSNTMYEDIYFSGHAYGAKVYHCHFYAYGYYGEEKYIGGCTYSLPINPVIGDDKNTVVPGQSITFWYSGLRECSKVVFNFIKNGEVYYSVDSTSSTEFTTYFENTGSYQVYVSGLYKGIWFDSNRITVNVLSPEIHDDKNSAAVGENITFEYSGLTECSYVELKFYKLIDNSYINYLNIDTTSSRYYTTYFENPGQYKICVSGYLNGNWVTSSSIDVHITKKISITYNINDVNGCTMNKEVIYNSPYGELPSPTRTGFLFGGWFTEEEGGTLVTSDTIVTATADHTLYAHWSHDTFILKETELSTQNKMITGAQLIDMSAKDLAEIFENSNLSVNMKNSKRMATGTTVNLIDDTDTVYDTMTVVIRGDVDGDGLIDGRDSLIVDCLVNNLLSKDQVGEAVFTAADCNRNGEIDSEDILLLTNAGLKLSTIAQA